MCACVYTQTQTWTYHFVSPLMDIWAASTLWLFDCELRNAGISLYAWLSALLHMPKSNGNSFSNILRNCHAVFCTGYTILYIVGAWFYFNNAQGIEVQIDERMANTSHFEYNFYF